MRRRSSEEIVARANEETFLIETIRAVRAVKIHGHEAQRERVEGLVMYQAYDKIGPTIGLNIDEVAVDPQRIGCSR